MESVAPVLIGALAAFAVQGALAGDADQVVPRLLLAFGVVLLAFGLLLGWRRRVEAAARGVRRTSSEVPDEESRDRRDT